MRFRAIHALAALGAVAISACGGLGSPTIDPAPSGPSSASIQNAYTAMSSALVNAVNAGTSKLNSSRALGNVTGLRPEASVTVPVFQQFESRTNCSGGGYVSVSVTMSGSITASESSAFGSIGWSGGESVVGCADGNGWTTSTNPALTMSGTLTINNSRLSMDIGLGGGWTMSSSGN